MFLWSYIFFIEPAFNSRALKLVFSFILRADEYAGDTRDIKYLKFCSLANLNLLKNSRGQ